jgi:uncharacterized protein YceK
MRIDLSRILGVMLSMLLLAGCGTVVGRFNGSSGAYSGVRLDAQLLGLGGVNENTEAGTLAVFCYMSFVCPPLSIASLHCLSRRRCGSRHRSVARRPHQQRRLRS